MSESRDVEVEAIYIRDKKIETARALLAETLHNMYNYLSPRKITRLAQQLVEDLEKVE